MNNLEFWNKQALKHKNSQLATTPDLFAAQLEIKEILKYLSNGDTVLDIGCGNGFKDIEYCKQRDIIIKGFDYSEEMIKNAKQYENENLSFEQGDILELNENILYDIVITNRCLINLATHEQQIHAIDNIYDVLKPGGKYLMMECTKQGLNKINEVRQNLELETIKERWHNKYLDEEKIIEYVKQKFGAIEINNFNSTYFLISRTINALEGCDYNSNINKIASLLPVFGDYAPLKLFIITKER